MTGEDNNLLSIIGVAVIFLFAMLLIAFVNPQFTDTTADFNSYQGQKVVFSPNGDYFAYASNGKLILENTDTDAKLEVMPLENSDEFIFISDEFLRINKSSGETYLYDIFTNSLDHSLLPHRSPE